MVTTPDLDRIPPGAAQDWRQRLAHASDTEARRLLLDILRTAMGSEFDYLALEFNPATHWRRLGIKGAAAERIRNRVSEQTGVPLPDTIFFDQPTPNSLCEFLRNNLRSQPELHRAPTAPARRSDGSEPIAIVGMACRYPGGVASAEDLWNLVISRTDAITSFPDDRGWDRARLYDPDPHAPGSSPIHYGGFLDDIAGFDADFFGISPREATAMHPEQRILLEIAWGAFEHAMIDPRTLHDQRVGVFAGTFSPHYGVPLHEAPRDVKGLALTGTTPSVASGRIAYLLGLRGPAITVDTACSGSLVAIHLACQSLRSGECELALAGGATITTTPGMFTEFARQHGLASDGRCKSFSETADGTSWSEGAGFLVLERLDDAQRAGHHVLAVIRGSAINQDGASNGLTAPSGRAQQDVITEALTHAGLSATDIDVVEAHGTGTRLGDPIEARALLATYGRDRSRERPLWLGSLKSNIGHTQAAAGVAAVIKMTMAFQNQTLPKTLHIDQPTTRVDWSAGTLRLLTDDRPWPSTDQPRRAGISSFGISGTNAHLLLEQPPHQSESQAPDSHRRQPDLPLVFPISGPTPQALSARATQLREYLSRYPDLGLDNVARSLATTRTHFSYRAAIAFRGCGEAPATRENLIGGLRALEGGELHPYLVTGNVQATGPGRLVFVFPGQGSQYPDMAMDLYRYSSVYAHALDACDSALRDFTGWSVLDVLQQSPGAPTLDQVDVVQPTLFAVMVSLAALWRSLGIVPDVVVGHSQGEIAAAYIAGALTLRDAAKTIAVRAQALTRLAGTGAMASVLLPHEQISEDGISVAAVNGPNSTTVAGSPDAIEEFVATCTAKGIHARRISVDYPSHAPQVEPIRQQLLRDLADLEPQSATTPFHSTVDSFCHNTSLNTTALHAEYWFTNVRNIVRFRDTIEALVKNGRHTFIEVSPHPLLTSAITDTLEQADAVDSFATDSLRRDVPALDAFALAAARLYSRGHTLDWTAINPRGHAVALPTYPFLHRRYWLAPNTTDHITQPDQPLLLGETTNSADLHTEPDVQPNLAAQLAGRPPDEKHQILADLVATTTATVLGYSTPDTVTPGTTFKELGIDSLTALDVRSHLAHSTGLTLPVTLVFDHPTPHQLTQELLHRLNGTAPTTDQPRTMVVDTSDPIAVVGMGCRYPGGINSPDQLWRLVIDGVDAIGEFPTDRGWNLDDLFDPNPDAPGKTYTRHGAFLADAAGFDCGFFGVSPREASAMDPQQRLLLEVCWESLESAGISPAALTGTDTGVFTGMLAQAYGDASGSDTADGYALTGTLTAVASGRVAYALGLHGPAITVDTACSSSLVAIHLACQSLRSGECDLALSGGVTVMATPTIFTEFARQRGLASDGRCKAFAADADGTGWGEGAGILVLERLTDARRNGHRVLAVIAGCAVNQDGASNGLTAPNGLAQQEVITRALANAGLSPNQVDVIEAHGTGTRLGDPIEAGALIATYGHAHRSDRPLYLGSIKSNIGHAQAAAGVAGVIKMIQAIRDGLLPKTLHIDTPTPHIDWNAGHLQLLTASQPWPDTGRPRTAAVSSFGISGTNAHLIIQQSEPTDTDSLDDATEPFGTPFTPIALSARTEPALRACATRLRTFLGGNPDLTPPDIAYTLAARRAHFDHRAVILAPDREQLLGTLDKLIRDQPGPGLLTSTIFPAGAGKIAYIFSGQGGQHPGMSAHLYHASPVFAAAFDEVCAALDPHLDRPLSMVVFAVPDSAEATLLNRTCYTQPALFALQTALFRLLEHLGLTCDYVSGHSIGEVTAVHVAGALALPEAAALVAARGRLMDALPTDGVMSAINAGEHEVAESLVGLEDRVTIAAVNAPASTVIAGDGQLVAELAQQWQAKGHRVHRLSVSHAFHSPHMDAMLEELRRVVQPLSFSTPRIPIVSTRTAEILTTAELRSPDYWAEQARHSVRFAEAVAWMCTHDVTAFVELGPHPLLNPSIEQACDHQRHSGFDRTAGTVVTGTLRRDGEDIAALLTALARLHTHGFSVDWRRLLPFAPHLDLPTYPFQHQRHWLSATPPRSHAVSAGLDGLEHPLLGAAVELPDGSVVLTGRLSIRTHTWLAEHAVRGVPLLPGMGFVELALRAGLHCGSPRVEELTVHTPLLLPPDDSIQLRVVVGPVDKSEQRPIIICSRLATAENHPNLQSDWTEHAAGTLAADASDAGCARVSSAPWPPPDAEQINVSYERLSERGYDYGPAFQGLRALWQRGDEMFAEVSLANQPYTQAIQCRAHPGMLDAALHPYGLLATEDTRLPFCFTGVSVHTAGVDTVRVHLIRTQTDTVSMTLSTPTGQPVATLESLVMRPVDTDQLTGPGLDANLLRLEWPRVTAHGDSSEKAPRWAILGDHAADLATTLRHIDPALCYVDLDAFEEAVADSAPSPDFLLYPVTSGTEIEDPVQATHEITNRILDLLQRWLIGQRTGATALVLLTRHAVSVDTSDNVVDLPGAAVWGLVRSAQSEHSGRPLLLDLDHDPESLAAVPTAIIHAIAEAEPQVALRCGRLHVPRIATANGAPLAPPVGHATWRLAASAGRGVEGLVLAPCQEVAKPLSAGQVRLAVRAAGVNFRDILATLGMVESGEPLGGEVAGVVSAIGSGVNSVAVGDCVMVPIRGAIGPVAVADHRLLSRIPSSWTFAQAASTPVAFLTAWHALVDLAELHTGQTVLIHAAAGGVGMAAIQIARHLGAEVFATAHPRKWDSLRAQGIRDDHLASSRTLEFEQQFRAATDGRGIDVVLHSLAREFTDASLRLVADGGLLIDIGKTDLRDPAGVATAHPGVSYRTFDILDDPSPGDFARMLAQLSELFERGALEPLPVKILDLHRAREAFQLMSQAGHIGKIVLSLPPSLDTDGTILITGGSGNIGRLVALHLTRNLGARHLILTSRRGAQAPGAADLVTSLEEFGAQVRLAACDITDSAAVAALLAEIPAEHPLTAVVHTAGVLADSILDNLTPDQLHRVLRPKVDGAWNLHKFTHDLDLSAFVLFSSCAGTLGTTGQANYAAANAFLDALATQRHHLGLPATALAWGMWQQDGGMTDHLSDADRARMRRLGIVPMPAQQALALFDASLTAGLPALLPIRHRVTALQAEAEAGTLPAVLRGMVRASSRDRSSATDSPTGSNLLGQLAGLSPVQQQTILLDLVRTQLAVVLGHHDAGSIDVNRPFKDLGIDSLSAVELRNRLHLTTGLPLPATLAFDQPTLAQLAHHLQIQLSPDSTIESIPEADEAAIRQALTTIPVDALRDAGLLHELMRLAGRAPIHDITTAIADADVGTLVRLATTHRIELNGD